MSELSALAGSEGYAACDDAAGKSAANEVKWRKSVRVNGSCIGIKTFLLSWAVDSPIAFVRVFVDLIVTDALKTSGAGQPRPETANPGEHI